MGEARLLSDEGRRIVFDGGAMEDLLVIGVQMYEQSAPTVYAYLNDLHERFMSDLAKVNLFEVFQVMGLCENGVWESPHYAANRIYRMKNRLGMDTTGELGF